MDMQQITAELNRILASASFRSRKLIKKFLHYAVMETLAGRGDDLNQYTIAVNALGKPADFSPIYNPVVRIEAGRLRKLLDDYYANTDALGSIKIKMPKGSYQVEFIPTNTQQLALNTVEFGQQHSTEGPRLFVHFQMLQAENEAAYPLFYKVRGDLLLLLSRFRNVRLVSSIALETALPLTKQTVEEIWKVYQADYILNCDVHANAGGVEFCFMLAHTLTDETVWRSKISVPCEPTAQTLQDLYQQVAANTVSLHSGLALNHWAQYLQSNTAALAEHHAVLVRYMAFLREITPDSFTQAVSTCQQRLKRFPNDSKALVILARLCGFNDILQYHLIPDHAQTWTNAARMAMKLDTGNAEAHSVFAHNSFFRGDYVLCRAELEIAYQANPYDVSNTFLYGVGLCLMGDWDVGVAMVERLMRVPFNQPDWYNLLPFVNAFNHEDFATALVWAERIQGFGYWGEVARCATYSRLGQMERARAEFTCLQQKIGVTDSATIEYVLPAYAFLHKVRAALLVLVV